MVDGKYAVDERGRGRHWRHVFISSGGTQEACSRCRCKLSGICFVATNSPVHSSTLVGFSLLSAGISAGVQRALCTRS